MNNSIAEVLYSQYRVEFNILAAHNCIITHDKKLNSMYYPNVLGWIESLKSLKDTFDAAMKIAKSVIKREEYPSIDKSVKILCDFEKVSIFENTLIYKEDSYYKATAVLPINLHYQIFNNVNSIESAIEFSQNESVSLLDSFDAHEIGEDGYFGLEHQSPEVYLRITTGYVFFIYEYKTKTLVLGALMKREKAPSFLKKPKKLEVASTHLNNYNLINSIVNICLKSKYEKNVYRVFSREY